MTEKQNNLKQHILNEIRRLSGNSNTAPGATLFQRETGIAPHEWRGKFWARWGDALTEAGYRPNDWTQRQDTEVVLTKVIEVCRYYQKVPTTSEFELYRRGVSTSPSINTIINHFGGRAGLISALWERVKSSETDRDIASMLPTEIEADSPTAPIPARTDNGFVYLIKSGDFYKIGRSDDIERRFKEIRISLPDKATLIHTIRTDDPAGIELYWHNRFKDKRANGEWFKLSAADLAAVKKRKFQ